MNLMKPGIKPGFFSGKPRLTHATLHAIYTGSAASKPYRYGKVNQGIIDYPIRKMLADDIILPINFPFAMPFLA